jgi:hypothetical protein
VTPDVKRWFLDRYVGHLSKAVNEKAETVRALQRDSGLAKERIVRYEISEGDVTRRDVPQNIYRYTFRVSGDGEFTQLPADTRPDVVVFTDLAAVWGVAQGRYLQAMPDGTKRLLSPFTIFDALRIGKVEWAGTSSALREMMLFERKVAPEFLSALKLPPPSA